METVYFGIIAIALAGQTPAAGKTPFPVEVKIKHEGEVRSGPDRTCFATSRVSAGDKVTVLHVVPDNPDWLAIAPPKKSYSWINAEFIKTIDEQTGVVDADKPVEVYAGSYLVDQKPNAVSAALVHGSMVIIINRPLKAGNEKWYPIATLPTEVRYIHKTLVDLPKAPAVAAPRSDDSRILLQRIEMLERRVRELEEKLKK